MAYGLAFCSAAVAQSLESQPNPPEPILSAPLTTCNPWIIQTLPTELSFRQRACLSLAEFASPGRFLGAGFGAGFSQWRNLRASLPRDGDDLGNRFAHIYERQAARGTAELLVGYLHREDPRLRFSNAHGWVNRTRVALWNVMISPDEDGHARPAFAPIAGSLGCGLTSMALFQYQNGLSDGFRRSGIAYSGYFARALVHEFSPELWSLAPRFIRKRHDGLHKAFTL